jgi:hypothetical protein
MSAGTYSRIAGTIFTLFALVHAYRLVSPFPVQVGSISVPHAASWAVLVVAGALGLLGLRARP